MNSWSVKEGVGTVWYIILFFYFSSKGKWLHSILCIIIQLASICFSINFRPGIQRNCSYSYYSIFAQRFLNSSSWKLCTGRDFLLNNHYDLSSFSRDACFETLCQNYLANTSIKKKKKLALRAAFSNKVQSDTCYRQTNIQAVCSAAACHATPPRKPSYSRWLPDNARCLTGSEAIQGLPVRQFEFSLAGS